MDTSDLVRLRENCLRSHRFRKIPAIRILAQKHPGDLEDRHDLVVHGIQDSTIKP
jgi:hypothetical protein